MCADVGKYAASRPLKNYLGFGFLRRPTSCIHAVVRWQYWVKNGLTAEG